MTEAARVRLVARLGVAACVFVSGYLHTQLYLTGYQFIPNIGVAFLWQSAVSFTVAILVAAGAPQPYGLLAVVVPLGSLGAFALSRTVGVLGFTEHGWSPAPQAALTVIVEVGALVLAVPAGLIPWPARWRKRGVDKSWS